jgi:hypothetical protein
LTAPILSDWRRCGQRCCGYVVDAPPGWGHLRTDVDEHDYLAVMTDPEGNEFCIH